MPEAIKTPKPATSMTKLPVEELFKTQWTQLRPKVKAQWTKLTNEDLDAINGKRDQLLKKIETRYGKTHLDAVTEFEKFEKTFMKK